MLGETFHSRCVCHITSADIPYHSNHSVSTEKQIQNTLPSQALTAGRFQLALVDMWPDCCYLQLHIQTVLLLGPKPVRRRALLISKGLLGPKPVRRRALLISKGLLGPKPVRRRALLISKGLLFFFFFFYFLFNHPGTFGGLNMLKNSWKFAHTLESVGVRTPQRLGPGRGTGALRRP